MACMIAWPFPAAGATSAASATKHRPLPWLLAPTAGNKTVPKSIDSS